MLYKDPAPMYSQHSYYYPGSVLSNATIKCITAFSLYQKTPFSCQLDIETGGQKSQPGPTSLHTHYNCSLLFYWAFLSLAILRSLRFLEASAPASVSRTKSHHLKLLA